jgi:acetyl-CoA carboxylase carboxyl transferase subunit alpha
MLNPLSDFERNVRDLQAHIDELRNVAAAQEDGEAKVVSQALENLVSQTTRLRSRRYANLTTWERVQVARHPERPHTLDYIDMIFTDWVELHGDRRFADDPAMVCGLARLNGRSVAIIGQQKGRDTKKRIHRNYGMPHPEGYRKALRVMELAQRFHLPVLAFVDTPGAYPGIASEERGIAEAIAVNLREMAVLDVPILAIVIGEGGSGGALGIAVADRVLMLENSWYCVISPEGCASILWRTPEMAPAAAEALQLAAPQLEKLGVIDEIIPEPAGGAHANWKEMAAAIRDRLQAHLDELLELSGSELVQRRIERFAAVGVWHEKEKRS